MVTSTPLKVFLVCAVFGIYLLLLYLYQHSEKTASWHQVQNYMYVDFGQPAIEKYKKGKEIHYDMIKNCKPPMMLPELAGNTRWNLADKPIG